MNACIVRCTHDNKILLVKHRERSWEFPGGKVDFYKDDFAENLGYYDLLKTATREFQEEVTNQIGCVGAPDHVLYKYDPASEYSTVFFVYKESVCLFDCFDKYKLKLSHDEAIHSVKEFAAHEINELYFSYPEDRDLIIKLLE